MLAHAVGGVSSPSAASAIACSYIPARGLRVTNDAGLAWDYGRATIAGGYEREMSDSRSTSFTACLCEDILG